MRIGQSLMVLGLAVSSLGCELVHHGDAWKVAVANQVGQLGYRNWIVIAEPSLPAQNRPGIRQVTTNVEIPEVVDYVLDTLEQTQRVRPQIYLTREQRAIDNEYTPGIDEHRRQLATALRSHETTELEQQSLLTLLEDASQNFNILVIRTPTALPYTSVFIELQPGYWDAESETRLRERISRERIDKLARPTM
ncbi:MAG: hypothetical protein DVB25_00060 [Verrucomicrobia bacterium]|nr:MAG: hypothetical protein DVB25_00060 [Verrucomicrobiota bacterium]